MLDKQHASETSLRDQLLAATENMEIENKDLKFRCQQQNVLLGQQQEQFKECSKAIEQAKKARHYFS